MHQTRRRKKRPSYGVRTIEIVRGRNGFGFTISGQAPCILSCIVNGSPAERAGLRPGDYLIAVNGQNVSKAPHDDVVRMIGSCQGLLKLQIAENYYSNSSDDEITPATRPRPKYPHRFRQRQQQNHHNGGNSSNNNVNNNNNNQQNHQCPHNSSTAPFYGICPSPSVQPKVIQRSDNHDYKNISDVHMQPWKGTLQQELIPQSWIGNAHTVHCKHAELTNSSLTASSGHRQKPVQLKGGGGNEKKIQQTTRRIPTPCSRATVVEKENQQPIFSEHEINSIVYPSLQQLQCNSDTEESIYKAVVGYLGTIEMPKEPQLPGHRLSAIRNCIRRLRVEKKVHTLVLLKVFSDKVTLTNSHGATMAEYLTERITFCGAYADDKKFFGLVTTRAEVVEVCNEESVVNSSSCHVFMVDPKLLQHEEHLKRAKSFRINCVPDMGSGRGECCEFPESVDPILVAIVGLYKGRGGMPLDLNANVSPQPSNTSSNSDSGIGFRDEGQNSDRVSIVDLDNDYGYLFPLPHPQRVGPEPVSWKSCPLHSQQRQCFGGTVALSKKDSGPSNNPSIGGSKLTVRAMPDPVGFTNPDTSYNTELLNIQQEPPNIRKSVQKYLQRTMGHHCGHPGPLLPPGTSVVNMIRSVSPVLISTRPGSPDAALLRLSPKVYDTSDMCQIMGEPDGEYQDSDGVPTLPDDNTENTCEQEGSQDVHPPTQEEDTETSSQENDVDLPDEGKRWSRSSSFRKQLKSRFGNSKGQEGSTFSDGELINGKVSISDGMVGLGDVDVGNGYPTNMVTEVGRVGSWAVSFEKLLADPAGMHTFAEFLKKEFSFENIAFWVACERYRKLKDENQMKISAKEIFRRHIALGSLEPVNVDSHARQMVEEKLDCPTSDIFKLPQKQIFDLMKFDCYSRFLKASIYQECMVKEVSGETLPYLGDENLDPNHTVSAKQNDDKSKDGSEDRRRKSLLPWHRTKSGKTKKEKCSIKKGEKRDESCSLSLSDLTDSRSSLVNSAVENHGGDATQEPGSFCRVGFPDQSGTVVSVKSGETIAACLAKVLQRRGLSYCAFDVYWTATNKIVEQDKDCSILSGQEVRVEERTLLQVELPTKKTITLKGKPSLSLTDVLRPVLYKCNYQLDQVSVHTSGNGGNVDLNETVSALSTNCLVIQVKNKDHGPKSSIHPKPAVLNELTNKVLGDAHFLSESLDVQDNNNRSSFRDSRGFLKFNNCPGKPPIAARPSLPKNESDEMYDLWKRAQRSRLDDQRGTEINFELPEFLKTQPNDVLAQRFQEGRASEPNPVCRSKADRNIVANRLSRLNSEVFPPGHSRSNACDDSLLKDGVFPTHKQAEEYFSACHLGFGELHSGEHRNLRDLGLFCPSKRMESSHTVLTRPCSHPPLSVPTWCRSISVPSSTDLLKADRTSGQSLICADATFMEQSFSPSTVPPPADTSTSSIHGEMANYIPPSPMCPSSEKCPPQIPMRLPSDPPPLPPKPRPHRRPVPPAPAHLGHLAFCNNSDEDKCALSRQCGFLDASSSRLHSAMSEPCHTDKCSVSFV